MATTPSTPAALTYSSHGPNVPARTAVIGWQWESNRRMRPLGPPTFRGQGLGRQDACQRRPDHHRHRMRYWLMKSEPDAYSWDDLVAEGGLYARLARLQFTDGQA